MQQRDFIKDEIERIGRVLGKLITMMLGTEGGAVSPKVRQEEIVARLKNELSIDPDELLQLSGKEIRARLDDLNLAAPHFDQLGDFFSAWAGREANTSTKVLLYQRALLLYDLAGEKSGNYCMVRAGKEKALRKMIL